MNRSLILGVALLAGLALSLVSTVEAQNCCRRGRILQRVQLRGMFQRNNCCYTSTNSCNTGCATVQNNCCTPVVQNNCCTPVQNNCCNNTCRTRRVFVRRSNNCCTPVRTCCNTQVNNCCNNQVVSNSCGCNTQVATSSCGCRRFGGYVSTRRWGSCGCATTSSCGCATTTSSCGCGSTQSSPNNVVPQGEGQVKPEPAKGSNPPKPEGAKASGDDT